MGEPHRHAYAAPAQGAIEERCPRSIVRALRRAARRSDSGLCADGTLHTWADIDRLSSRLAAAMLGAGIGCGDRVAIALPAGHDFVIGCFAALKCRAIAVPIDPDRRAETVGQRLADAGPAVLLCRRELYEQATTRELPSLRAIYCAAASYETLECHGPSRSAVTCLGEVMSGRTETNLRQVTATAERARTEDLAIMTYTSGSTGNPKGVLHDHRSRLIGADFTRRHLGITARDRILIPLPLHHGLALHHLLVGVLAGATVVLVSGIFEVAKRIGDLEPTVMVLVPAAAHLLIDHFPRVLADAVDLRWIEIGAGPLDEVRRHQLAELAPAATLALSYGLTEARVGFLGPAKDGSFRKIAATDPELQIRVLDAAGRPVRAGGTGEIVLFGSGVMRGYWRRSEVENRSLSSHGLRTGDLAAVEPDGGAVLLGRRDEMLKVGGNKVHPTEIEEVLGQHPGVVEVAITADAPSGPSSLEFELHAHVVPARSPHRGRANVLADELQSHCRRFLEPFAVPQRFSFVESLPRSATGKVLRGDLSSRPSPSSVDPKRRYPTEDVSWSQ